MKDIGSIFPIQTCAIKNDKISSMQDMQLFSLCREALFQIAKTNDKSSKVVLLPTYTCQTVIAPFEQLGWKCCFYNIKSNLTVDMEDLLCKVQDNFPSIVLFHPYYGMKYSEDELESIQHLRKKGIVLIEDLTQCIFLSESEISQGYFDYYVGSLRKWLPIPDGAFLYPPIKDSMILEENRHFVDLQCAAMFLRDAYFKSNDVSIKELSRNVNKYANDSISHSPIVPHSISAVSKNVISEEKHKRDLSARTENSNYLYANLPQDENCHPVLEKKQVATAPLYVPIYANKRDELQSYLAKAHIYAPILWPMSEMYLTSIGSNRKIYDNILVLPCDQRYTISDMNFIVASIGEFYKR